MQITPESGGTHLLAKEEKVQKLPDVPPSPLWLIGEGGVSCGKADAQGVRNKPAWALGSLACKNPKEENSSPGNHTEEFCVYLAFQK